MFEQEQEALEEAVLAERQRLLTKLWNGEYYEEGEVILKALGELGIHGDLDSQSETAEVNLIKSVTAVPSKREES